MHNGSVDVQVILRIGESLLNSIRRTMVTHTDYSVGVLHKKPTMMLKVSRKLLFSSGEGVL